MHTLLLVLAMFLMPTPAPQTLQGVGSGLPASCQPGRGDVYLKTGLIAPGLYYCSAPDTWTSVTLGTAANCSSSAGTCSTAPTGAVTIAAAATTVTVATTAVTANSNILITENSAMGTRLGVTCNTTAGRVYAVTTLTAGTSFVITASAAPVTNPACLEYLIIN